MPLDAGGWDYRTGKEGREAFSGQPVCKDAHIQLKCASVLIWGIFSAPVSCFGT